MLTITIIGNIAGVEITDHALEAAKADLARHAQTAQSTATQHSEPVKPAPEPIQTQRAQPPPSSANPQRPFQKPGQYQQTSNTQQSQQPKNEQPVESWNPNDVKHNPMNDL